MIRLLIRTGIFLASSAVGLLVAALVLPDFTIEARAFILTVVIFAVLQAVLSPFIFKVAARNASALLGAVGLISTFLALVITNLFGGMSIVGAQTWLFATLIIWLVTMLATLLLPLLLVKRVVTGPGNAANPRLKPDRF